MSKKWWKSKTLWFNVVTAAVVLADKFSGNIISTDVAYSIAVVGNVILRFITKESIE